MILDGISLPNDFYWEDEVTWNKVVSETSYGSTGSLFIQQSEKKDGRYITLTGDNDSSCHITRDKLLLLQEKKDTLGLEMLLELPDGRTFNVVFRHAEDPIEVVAVNKTLKTNNDDVYILKSIKLMEKTNG